MAFILGACDGRENRLADPAIEQAQGEQIDFESQGAGKKGFYPLDIGNTWTYEGEITLTYEVGPPIVIETWQENMLVGTEERFGREYVLERERIIQDPDGSEFTNWIRYRQDKAGLYEADIPIAEPPLDSESESRSPAPEILSSQRASFWMKISAAIEPEQESAYRRGFDELSQKLAVIDAAVHRGAATLPSRAPALTGPPGGVLPNEITRLSYPLHPGQEWTIREIPLFQSMVISCDVLDLPPGRMSCWMIRIVPPGFGPNDEVLIWYGRQGFLRLFDHLEIDIVDPGGEPIDRLVFEEDLSLETLDLMGNGRF
jgi:hypothetical protein